MCDSMLCVDCLIVYGSGQTLLLEYVTTEIVECTFKTYYVDKLDWQLRH